MNPFFSIRLTAKKTVCVLLAGMLLAGSPGCAKKEWDVFSEKEREILHRLLAHWETWMPARKADGTAPLITFEDLYQGLSPAETGLLYRVRAVRPEKGTYVEIPQSEITFKRLEGQTIQKAGQPQVLDPQYLPEPVYEAYENMMKAMEKDLGKRLLVESGYRSPAYQLYTFLFFLPKYHYSLKETREWVALPGFSEHGNPRRQAIDFINPLGVNGEDRPEEFENLPEYAWLSQRARDFGFELSFPRGTPGSAFEPWHWRHEG